MTPLVHTILNEARRTPITPEGLDRFYAWLLTFPDECFFSGPFRRPPVAYAAAVPPRRARLVSFDGLSGAGKDTQAGLLDQALTPDLECWTVVQKRCNPFREPLMAYWKQHPYDCNHTVVIPLLWAGRRYCTEMCLHPAWSAPARIILQCRSFLSDVIFVSNDSADLARRLGLCVHDPRPDLGVVLTVSPTTATARLRQRAIATQRPIQPQERPEVLERTAALYDRLLSNPPGPFVRVDAERPVTKVHHEILNMTRSILAAPQSLHGPS